jgi:hypothetical protein
MSRREQMLWLAFIVFIIGSVVVLMFNNGSLPFLRWNAAPIPQSSEPKNVISRTTVPASAAPEQRPAPSKEPGFVMNHLHVFRLKTMYDDSKSRFYVHRIDATYYFLVSNGSFAFVPVSSGLSMTKLHDVPKEIMQRLVEAHALPDGKYALAWDSLFATRPGEHDGMNLQLSAEHPFNNLRVEKALEQLPGWSEK